MHWYVLCGCVPHSRNNGFKFAGVSEAIRSAKLARSDLKKEREDYDSLLHELDIMKMKVCTVVDMFVSANTCADCFFTVPVGNR